MKKIDLMKTLSELCREYPELPDILSQAGLTALTSPIAMDTLGSMMTIPQGAILHGRTMADIIDVLHSSGFETDYPQILSANS